MGHSQSKTFWSFLILVDVLLLVAFGWALADRLYTVLEEPVISVQPAHLPKARDKKAPVTAEAPLGPPSPVEAPKAEPKVEEAKAPEPAKKEEAKKPEPARKEEAKKADDAPVKAKKVVFSYKNKSARKVSIEGTFTKWDSKPMSKNKAGDWTFTTYLLPGLEYPYRFVVDGKIITDPANPKEKWGKSLMPVK